MIKIQMKLSRLIVKIELIHTRNRIQSVKVKFTLEQAMKAQRGSTGIALLFP
jgi:hypothetical protein